MAVTFPEDAAKLRDYLIAGNLSQRGAARALGINERTMRKYCAASIPVPEIIFKELRDIVAYRVKMGYARP